MERPTRQSSRRPRGLAGVAAACRAGLALALLVGAALPARGVIIDTVTGTGNTTAPADDPGWANVGVRGIGSGVYLGDRWVLSAVHVGAGSITLGGTVYSAQAGTAFALSNAAGSGQTATADLLMFRLTTDPGLPTLPIAASSPADGAAVTMIGAGRDRGAFKTWQVNSAVTPWVWTESSVNPDAAGYQFGAGRTMRWGTNTVSGAGWFSDGYGDAYGFATTFEHLGGPSTEAQAAFGDSGGGVFRKNGSVWELAGIILAIDEYSGQPGGTAVYGNSTYIADLSYYRSQIVAVVVPEPTAGVLVAIGVASAVWWRRARRRRPGSLARGPRG